MQVAQRLRDPVFLGLAQRVQRAQGFQMRDEPGHELEDTGGG